MRCRTILILLIMTCVAGCALFGVFSWSKNGAKEMIEVRHRRAQIKEAPIGLDDLTLQRITAVWNAANPAFVDQLETYTMKYNEEVIINASQFKTPGEIFRAIILRTVRNKNLPLPLNLTLDDFGAVLAFPEGVEPCVYWFIVNASFPLLGMTYNELFECIVP